MEFLVEYQLEFGHIIRPLIVGTLVSTVCSVIGCFIILRGMAFLADAIAHSMLAGVIAGYLFIKLFFGEEAHLGAMLIGAILAGVVTVAMVGFVTRFSRIKQDTAIGIMYSGIFALGAFVISLKPVGRLINIDIYHYIIGSVLSVPNEELWLLAIVTSVVLSVVLLFYRTLQITSFDPIMAASLGIPIMMVDYMLTACTSLVVVSGVQIAGVILVVALIITPAATSYLLSDRLDRMICLSAAFGVGGFWLGFALASVTGGAPGPTVVVTMTGIFLITLAVAPRYGLLADWIRKSSAIPQEVMEDVLGAILRSDGHQVAVAEIEKRVTTRNMEIRKAINMLVRRDLLERENGSVRLTEEGEFEANRLVRAHRLWETYLEQTGIPETEIHQKAHKLEHISDQQFVEYLDDKLGHPLTDPHGSQIPVNSKLKGARQLFVSSLLRKGDKAIVKDLLPVAGDLNVKVGQSIEAGDRADNGLVWTFVLDDGRTLMLNHEQADGVIVQWQQES
ncbi:MAG: iron chelate uptake ABC transporter family permease subunit [Planctomycetota bacterium]